MTGKRLWQTIRLWSMRSSIDRVNYLRRKKIFDKIGNNVLIMDRKVPLYARLIRIHDNVVIGSNVAFVTHDATHFMLNRKFKNSEYKETIGCIEILDNVFIGANTTILNNVRIGPNAIVAAGAVITKDVAPNTVVGGVPARTICSLEEYLLKRNEITYPEELAPKKQEVTDQLINYMWNEFENQRK